MSKTWRECIIWGAAGTFVGITLSYYLYRVGLPLKPFIYQAF